VSQIPPASSNIPSVEIDLVEWLEHLWKQKLLITLVTLIVTAVAASYVFLSEPVYEAKTSLLPPRLADIAGYNLGRAEAGLPEFTVEKIYSIFTQNLRSENQRNSFFQEIYLPAEADEDGSQTKDQLREKLNKKLVVSNPDVKNSPDRFEVTAQSAVPSRAAEWANLYVERAARKTRQDMADTAATEINMRVRSIKSRIEVLRESAKQLREDRIARLNEALIVADKVGVQAPQVKASRTSSDGELEKFVDGNLMYMLGAKAIRVELTVLQSRTNDDPFIPDLRDLENRLDYLSKVSVSPNNVAVFTLDNIAEVPDAPIKSKKTLILVLGIVLGGMLGVFVALIRVMWVKRRQINLN
jgi:chain length determinant protein (polysaccharide antigen chain regulator)